MRDYIYPKVPNHYHDTVTDDFFTNTDVVITEKLDGSNCKVTTYDTRYAELYGDDVHELNPEHGDVIISTKKTVQGILTDDIQEFDGAFHRLVKHLRETLSAKTLLTTHEEYDSPLVLFGEHMLRVTLDYDYDTNPPPALIGFDILVMREYGDQPANPLEQRFNGFLHVDEAYTLFKKLGIETARILARTNTNEITQTGKELDVAIPESEYAETKAEGIVLRSHANNRRVKYVAEEFRERSRKSWSALAKNCDTGAEMFCAKFVTNPRIQKTIMKTVNDPDVDTVTPDHLVELVVMDAWNEELPEIMKMDVKLNPSEIRNITRTRCETVLETFKTNAALNNTEIDNIWTGFVTDTTINQSQPITNPDEKLVAEITTTDTDSIEHTLLTHLISDTTIITTAIELCTANNTEFGNWVIPEVNTKLQSEIWHTHLDVLANLPVAFNPTKLKTELVNNIRDTITTYTAMPPTVRQAHLTAHILNQQLQQTNITTHKDKNLTYENPNTQ